MIGLMIALGAAAPIAAADVLPPLRTADGEPVCAVYFFPHWWEPWKSSDEEILRDLALLRSWGINTLLIDHEWSQAIDGNFALLDRSHRLAKQAGMQIAPWLSLKTWSDMASSDDRRRLVREMYGVELSCSETQEGQQAGLLPYDEATIAAGVAYTEQYLERYLQDGALARFLRDGKACPAVALTVELAWPEGGFDERTNARFRDWCRARYATVERLNQAWGTALADFAAVEPTDTAVFDFPDLVAGTAAHPAAGEDHVQFRSELVNEGLAEQKRRLLAKYPDLLIVTELPYQAGAEHPHAIGYRIGYAANPVTADHADVVVLRLTGPLTPAEQEVQARWIRESGKQFILCYRTYSDWGALEAQIEPLGEACASLVAAFGHGIGFYSWNEMVDVHLAEWRPGAPDNQMTVRGEVAARMQRQAEAITRHYREAVARLPQSR